MRVNRRAGEPDDIAKAAVWFGSDQADDGVGATLFVDGGMTRFPAFSTCG
jgi:glucose 1-dehydrogenase